MCRKHRLSVTHALCQLNTTIPHANDCNLKTARQNPEELRGPKPEFPAAELGLDPGCLLRKRSIQARQRGQNPPSVARHRAGVLMAAPGTAGIRG